MIYCVDNDFYVEAFTTTDGELTIFLINNIVIRVGHNFKDYYPLILSLKRIKSTQNVVCLNS